MRTINNENSNNNNLEVVLDLQCCMNDRRSIYVLFCDQQETPSALAPIQWSTMPLIPRAIGLNAISAFMLEVSAISFNCIIIF